MQIWGEAGHELAAAAWPFTTQATQAKPAASFDLVTAL